MPLAGGAVFRGRAGSPLGWRGPAPQQPWVILQHAVRLPLSALAFAVSFAAGGQRRKDDSSFLLTLRETRPKLGRGRSSPWRKKRRHCRVVVSEPWRAWSQRDDGPVGPCGSESIDLVKVSPPCHRFRAPGQPARSQYPSLSAGGGGCGGRRICDLQGGRAAGAGHPADKR